MVYDRGKGFFGTQGIKKTSKTMEEVLSFKEIQENPKNKYINAFYKFNFDNKQDCTVFINDSEFGIFLEAGNGWVSDEEDALIKSFKVKEVGIDYKWVGHY